jgi:DNA-binding MarR family transcriptional regulator
METEPSDNDQIELAMRLRMAIARLARNLRQQSDSELTPSQQILLATILDHGPATPTELAAREQVSAPTISRALGGLEEQHLVSRRPDETDGRVTKVLITDEGRTQLTLARTRRNAWLAQRLGDLDKKDRERLTAALNVLERLTERTDS